MSTDLLPDTEAEAEPRKRGRLVSDPEAIAIQEVLDALLALDDQGARQRVIASMAHRFGCLPVTMQGYGEACEARR